jgi:hypothetical protein
MPKLPTFGAAEEQPVWYGDALDDVINLETKLRILPLSRRSRWSGRTART